MYFAAQALSSGARFERVMLPANGMLPDAQHLLHLGLQPEDFAHALPDGTRYPGKGRLNFAATQIDLRLGTQQLRAEFDNPNVQLLPGQFARVQLVAGQHDNVFLVPQVAVMQAEKGYFVFVVDKDGKASMRPVQVGDWIGTDWVITAGLAAGDGVIVDNLLKLRPGSVVTAVAPADAKPALNDPARPAVAK